MKRTTRAAVAAGATVAILAGAWALDASGAPPGLAGESRSPRAAGAQAQAAAQAAAQLEAQAEAERLAIEAQRAEEEAAAARAAEEAERAQAPAPREAPQSWDGARPGCEGSWAIPAWIVQRESGCNYGAVNASGCGGWSCVGAYQFDLRHWLPREEGGWGGCAWLGDWRVPENQDACASQMSRGGTNLAPWGA